MSQAFIGIGSNLGDRLANLKEAVQRLHLANVEVGAVSSVYESAAMIVQDQPDFLNIVCRVETGLTPRGLLERCLEIEQEMGRHRETRYGPRNIDLDLLLYDRVSCTEPNLTLPHPGLLERAFVVVPLLEIAPDAVLPDATPISEHAAPVLKDQLRLVHPSFWSKAE